MKIKSVLILLVVVASSVIAQKITVGTKIAEPFVIKSEDSKWEGVSFDLWHEVAEELKWDYEIREYDLDGLIKAVTNGNVDITVSPLTINAEREKMFDFSHPYYVTGLTIAASAKGGSFWSMAERIFSTDFFEAVGLLSLVLLIVGFLAWLFERKRNKEQFGTGPALGIGHSFWWAAVTMTTVGYGDMAPKTLGGRIIGLIWMFAAIIIISTFTAAIASALTVGQLDSNINNLNDLYNATSATVEGSSSESYLIAKGISYQTYPTVQECIDALEDGGVDAVVYDAPILKYLVKKQNLTETIKVLPINLEPLYYGFAMPTGSELREKVNGILLEKISTKKWKETLFKYFGE